MTQDVSHRTAASAVTLGGLAVVAIAAGGVATGQMGESFAVAAAVLYGLAGALLLGRVKALRPFARFGPANTVTLGRLVAACLLGGMAAEIAVTGRRPDDALAWTMAAAAGLALASDGLDGWLARRRGIATDFGARFDMEVDAFLILLLAMLAWLLGKAGAWILAVGLARYLFVAAAVVRPWLARPLPESWRRKTVCAVAAVALTALLFPIVTPAMGFWIGLIAVVSIAYSFGADVAWLAERRDRP